MYIIYYRTLKSISTATTEFFAVSKVLFVNYELVFWIRDPSRWVFWSSGYEAHKNTLKPMTDVSKTPHGDGKNKSK